jgi:hypothetical protein
MGRHYNANRLLVTTCGTGAAPRQSTVKQVGNLLSLVSKLRTLAKLFLKIIKMSKNKFLGFSFGNKTVDVQEFNFIQRLLKNVLDKRL